jgi:hypothetical protein
MKILDGLRSLNTWHRNHQILVVVFVNAVLEDLHDFPLTARWVIFLGRSR